MITRYNVGAIILVPAKIESITIDDEAITYRVDLCNNDEFLETEIKELKEPCFGYKTIAVANDGEVQTHSQEKQGLDKRLLEQQTCVVLGEIPSDEMTLEQARQEVKNLRKWLYDEIVEGEAKNEN